MTAFIYTRVSTKDQALDGTSLETQAEACLRYCDNVGFQLAEITNVGRPGICVDAGVSAFKKKFAERVGGRLILAHARPGDHIVMHTLDRAFRSVYDFSKQVKFWSDRNITVHLVSENIRLDTANGRLIANIISSIAQWKSELLSERMREYYAMVKDNPDCASGKVRRRGQTRIEPQVAAVLNRPRPEAIPVKSQGRVFAYARVSTTDQNPLTQHAQLDRYSTCLVQECPELTYKGVYDDHGESAYRKKFHERKTGRQLDEVMEAGDHLIVLRPDRVFRSLVDMGTKLQEWKERGIVLHFAESGLRTDDPMTQPMVDILVMVAQWESRDIGRRASMGYRAAQAMGKYMPGPDSCRNWLIVDYDDSGDKLVYPDVNVILELWHIQLMRKHGMSWDAISDHMEQIDAHREGRPALPRGGAERTWLIKYWQARTPSGRSGFTLRKWLNQLPPQETMIRRRWQARTLSKYFKESVPVMWEYLNARSAGSAMWMTGSQTRG